MKRAKKLAAWLGYLREKEVEALYYLALACEALEPVIVNVGAGAGTSALTFAEARKDAQIYSVDISPSGPLGGLEGERNAFKNTGLRLPTQILGKSHDVAREWKGPKIDLLFIDDGHAYDEVVGDITLWLPHVKKHGFVAFHDYQDMPDGSPRWPDVKRAVDELMSKYEVVARADSVIAFEV